MDKLWLDKVYTCVFSVKMLPIYLPLLVMSAISALSVVYLYCKNRGSRRKGYMDVEEKP